MWLSSNGANTVSKISAATNELTATFDVGPNPIGLAVQDDVVWVAHEGDDTVWRIDTDGSTDAAPSETDAVTSVPIDGPTNLSEPATPAIEPTATITVGDHVDGGMVTEDGVWAVVTEEDMLYLIDPDTNSVVKEVPVPGDRIPLRHRAWRGLGPRFRGQRRAAGGSGRRQGRSRDPDGTEPGRDLCDGLGCLGRQPPRRHGYVASTRPRTKWSQRSASVRRGPAVRSR